MATKTKMTPEAKIIGQNLKSLRKIRKVSQIDLAEILGVSFQQVQKYERGVNRLPVDKLHTVKEKLNIPYEFFFQGIGELDGQSSQNIGKEISKEIKEMSDQNALINILSIVRMFKNDKPTLRATKTR